MKETEKYKIKSGHIIVIKDIEYYLAEREKFLKSKNILTRFKRIEKREGISWLELSNIRQLIDIFIWEDTLDGYSYWHKINTEWLEHIGIFGKYRTLSQYKIASEKVDVFKSLLNEIDEDGFDIFKSAFMSCNENLELFVEDTLLRTFLGGYSNAEVLKLWLDTYDLNEPHWQNVLLILNGIDKLIYKIENDPKANASMLLECLRSSPQLLEKGMFILSNYKN